MFNLSMTYLLHGSVCFALAMVLFFFRVGKRRSERRYVSVLRMLGALLLIELIPDLLVLFDPLDMGRGLLYYFIRQALAALQLCGAFFIIYRLTHVPDTAMRWLYYSCGVILLLSFLHPALCAEYMRALGCDWSGTTYLHYCETPWVTGQRWLLLGVVGVMVVANLSMIIRYYVSFRMATRRYVIDEGPRMARVYRQLLVIGGVFVSVYAVCIFLVTSYETSLLAWAVVDLFLAIYVLNLRRDFVVLEKASLYFNTQRLMGLFSPIQQTSGMRNREQRQRDVIARLADEWEHRPDRPYMRPGITMGDMARDLNVPVGVLRSTGMSVLGITFEEYITSLREGGEPSLAGKSTDNQ